MNDLDMELAHRTFAVNSFNTVWTLLEKENRTPEEDEQMVHLTHASLWHWSQCQGHTVTNLAIGYWQISRVYATLGEADNALKFGERCLTVSRHPDVPPFYQAYAYEALSRAAWLGGDSERAKAYRTEALRLADNIEHHADRGLLLSDLESISAGS